MDLKLKNKVVIVTGAGRGIGKSVAIGFAKEGAKIVVNDIYSSRAQSVVRKIKSLGPEAIAITADVSKKSQVLRMVNRTLKTFGRMDVLINNAGIAIRKPLSTITEDFWDKTIDIRGL